MRVTTFTSLLLSPFLTAAALAASSDCKDQKKVVQYYGRTSPYGSNGHQNESLLPLVNKDTGGYVTNVLMSTWEIEPNGTVSLNKVPPSDKIFDFLWPEMKTLQQSGVKVHMMLLGWYHLLEMNSTSWDIFYPPIHDALEKYGFDGMDIDIEDAGTKHPFSLNGTVKLIDQLRKDFGPDFLITFAPVASQMSGGTAKTSFSYEELEKMRKDDIAWYNVQFYNGFGSLASTDNYEAIIKNGWTPDRIVAGMPTSSIWHGWAPLDKVAGTVKTLVDKYPTFAGIDGWEYTNGQPGGQKKPWEWAKWAAQAVGNSEKCFMANPTSSSTATTSAPTSTDAPGISTATSLPSPTSSLSSATLQFRPSWVGIIAVVLALQ